MAGKRTGPKNGNTAWYVYTTLSNGTEYIDWEVNPINNIPNRKYSVTINGGAMVVAKKGLITPLGVMTEITQEQMDFLNNDPTFQRHVKDGWMTVVKAGGWRDDPDTIASNMAYRDGCSPDRPEDYEVGKEGKLGTYASPAIAMRHGNRRPTSAFR